MTKLSFFYLLSYRMLLRRHTLLIEDVRPSQRSQQYTRQGGDSFQAANSR